MKPKTKALTKLPEQLEILKSIRREMPPKGKTILSKKDKLFRKRKHKKLDSD